MAEQSSMADAIDDQTEDLALADAADLVAAGDDAAAEGVYQRLLDRNAFSIRGHIGKAECRARAGDDDAANLLYTRALRMAQDRPLSRNTEDDVRRAVRALADLRARVDRGREARLAARAVPRAARSPRFQHALDLAAGRRRLYRQEPTAFHYPDLPLVQFFDAAQFDWAADVEAATPAIRAELDRTLAQSSDDFRAYIQNDSGSGPLGGNKALLDNKDWSVLALCENGWLSPELIRRFPVAWETVLRAPVPRIAGWGPTVVFSMLKAGAHIAPHSGMFNTRLICHLPLIVPPGCRFRVGDEVREWEVGKLLIFDDSIEHEAWNDSPDDRVVLIFDIWRPELSERERHELTALFSD